MKRLALSIAVALTALTTPAHALPAEIEQAVTAVTPRMIAWRRDIHQHPELGNRETRTAALVARHLRSLRLDEVRTGVARTGVVGILRGGRPGPIIALRADMDALPVTEQVDVPFKSTVRTTYNGQDVGVMHACGHDTHVAIMMAAAEVLARRRAELAGTVMFIFQPAEEGPPFGEEGGAELMLKEGLFNPPMRPEAVFALHATNRESGRIYTRTEGLLAGSERIRILVKGRQTHAARPHEGIDPITIAGQILTGLQTIPSRQMNAVEQPVVISIGRINGGIRHNIIPPEVEMMGTMRVLDEGIRDDIHARITRMASEIAAASGAEAEVSFHEPNPVTVNERVATRRGMQAVRAALGDDAVVEIPPIMGAEDFSFFAREVPGFFFFFGVNAPGVADAPPNHSPLFSVYEPGLQTGLKAMLAVALDRLSVPAGAAASGTP
ncbi:MAG: amidohydrolase [Hyphomonadaceae bacterium]|nr:amidohydrolase [Hyphomonadaceae bacterium]